MALQNTFGRCRYCHQWLMQCDETRAVYCGCEGLQAPRREAVEVSADKKAAHNAEHAAVPTQKAYFVGIHVDHFQSGTPAEILGVKMVMGPDRFTYHPCYHLLFPDGREDYARINDRDAVGVCGLGTSYKIISEDDLKAGKIPAKVN